MPRLVPPAEARRKCGGISESTHYRLLAAGDFPKPIVLSRTRSGRAARIAFLEDELDAWIAAKVQANRGEASA